MILGNSMGRWTILSVALSLVCVTAVGGESCGCPIKYEPVCASNGQTYESSCELNCVRRANPSIYQTSPGPCRAPPTRGTPNDNRYSPDSSRGYPSMQNNNQYTASQPCNCVLVFEPICGSDGKTYVNSCGFNCALRENANLRIAYDGTCRTQTTSSQPDQNQQDSNNCVCPSMYDPVCGSDEKTYPNSCSIDCEIRKNPSTRLRVAHRGECVPSRINVNTEQCQPCPLLLDPVCGSDNQTYANSCEFDCESTKHPYKRLSIAHRGQCASTSTPNNNEQCRCPQNYSPVCGSDQQTYSNRCEFDCETRKSPQRNLAILHAGECDPRRPNNNDAEPCAPCPQNYSPICGTDDRTYFNRCEFECETKKNPYQNVGIRNNGECMPNRAPTYPIKGTLAPYVNTRPPRSSH